MTLPFLFGLQPEPVLEHGFVVDWDSNYLRIRLFGTSFK